MTDRFNVSEILLAHSKGMRNHDYSNPAPEGTRDNLGRVVLYGGPLAVGVSFYLADWVIASPEALLAGFALLAGAFLASFTQLASWRDRLTERLGEREITDEPVRDSLDAAVGHVCVATVSCMMLVAELIIAMNFADPKSGSIGCVGGAIAAAGGTFLLLLVLVIVRCLYTAYATVNNVRPDMSGLHRG